MEALKACFVFSWKLRNSLFGSVGVSTHSCDRTSDGLEENECFASVCAGKHISTNTIDVSLYVYYNIYIYTITIVIILIVIIVAIVITIFS